MSKLVLIVYDSGLDFQILHVLKNLHITAYTKITNVKGAGNSGLKFGDAVGPGENNLVFTIIEEKTLIRLKNQIKVYKKNLLEKQGLKLFILPIEEII